MDKHKRTSDKIEIEFDRYFIDGIPVCCAWWGDDKFPRMMCKFYGSRKFGCQPVCMMTGEDLHEEPNIINRVPETCILHS